MREYSMPVGGRSLAGVCRLGRCAIGWYAVAAIALWTTGCDDTPTGRTECEFSRDCPSDRPICRTGRCVAGEGDGGTTDASRSDAAPSADAARPADGSPTADANPDAAPPGDASDGSTADDATDASTDDARSPPMPDACTASPEVCDGRDNDCDGEIDEDFADLGATCEVGIGACAAAGVQVCATDGADTICGATPGAPGVELCNGADDDCDGETDEDVDETCWFGPPHAVGVGRCAPGTLHCVDGRFGDGEALLCNDAVLPSAETCDGTDEDCDGLVDEDTPAAPCYDGDPAELQGAASTCRAGFRACENGALGRCVGQVLPAADGTDVCDRLDTDCDGLVDEDCVCRDGAPCDGEAVGACDPGVQVCDGDRLAACAGRVDPTDEICNSRDDDCDGDVDEDADVPCYGGPSGTEGTGECRGGLRRCDRTVGVLRAVCEDEVIPRAERCNGVDDDCDGQTDDGFPDLRTPCETGAGACAAAGVRVCAPDARGTICRAFEGDPTGEVCNGIDDDCDGEIDEDLEAGCYPGPEGTAGVGACRAGRLTCTDGAVGACEGAVSPADEVCDGEVDEDCDGAVDEGCDCDDGAERACADSNEGACRGGVQRCDGGLWGPCEGAVAPASEICNGVDDDCDSEIDEIFADLGLACAAGVGRCRANGTVVCGAEAPRCDAVPGEPRPELCDGVDDDCDGLTDEDLERSCYFGPPETIGVGACRAGASRCVDGAMTICEGEIRPSPEICNGIDDDCDGAIDEAVSPAPCYDGDPRDLAAGGLCRAGVQRCLDGAFGACEDQIGPADTDGCDGVDADCDGVVDEDCQCEHGAPCVGSALGACRPGIQVCDGEAVAFCEGRIDPGPEICNGVDDDCDGAVDEDADVACYDGPVATRSLGACRGGRYVCDRATGALGAICEGQVQPDDERCNGLDDDCDGRVDEDFGALGAACDTGIGACGGRGVRVCAADGNSSACEGAAAPPKVEICNGIDDDCDGAVDDDADSACYAGPDGTAGVGICRAGTAPCEDGRAGACRGQITPRPEACDGGGLDEDCDGAVDEGCACDEGEERACGNDVGACRAGVQVCVAGAFGPCVGIAGPSAERCNGIDDDCDGEIDEGYPGIGGACVVGVGACTREGVRVCRADGGAVVCTATAGDPAPEVCDGVDDDCDGQIDEALARRCWLGPNRAQGVGVCRAGLAVCIDGGFASCADEVRPGTEICDGLDNDCDGAVDNGVPTARCYEGDPDDLTAPDGTCRRGRRTCVDGAFGACDGQILPTDDGCNGLDDDCDGTTDEGCACTAGAPCDGPETGECTPGVQVCDGDAVAECEGRVDPRAETCDGEDDDCDGSIDEDADAVCYDGSIGTAGVGVCRTGVRACDRRTGTLGDTCEGQIVPSEERCNGLDDDCDGQIDEAFADVGAPCVAGVGACVAAGLRVCAPDGMATICDARAGDARGEVCNGVDDDCDGIADEDADATCYSGPAGTAGLGACRAGIRLCDDGRAGDCEGEVGPAPELCDGAVDESCDGAIDEGCACADGDERPCGADVGACEAGVQACRGGAWGGCDGARGPTPETCDGIDNDCDGAIDEDFGDLGARCAAGVGACADEGRRVCAPEGDRTVCDARPNAPRPEICDGIDDDCDGETDEDLDRGCYAGPAGTAGVGVCREGRARCVLGRTTACEGEVRPSPEVCDGLDNDCDGIADEDVPQRACFDGDPDQLRGRCREGRQVCADGVFGACEGQIAPAPGPDACNGEDDDCDGTIDEDCECIDGLPCDGLRVGRCAPGTQICAGGELDRCAGRAGPRPEICDGLDDDCDGTTDEDADLVCYFGPAGTEGVGLCRAGARRCDPITGRLAEACNDQIRPTDELCDGLDNDCDGTIDEDFEHLGGPCIVGVGACRAQGLSICDPSGQGVVCDARPGAPSPERCDGVDEDCDGAIDEETDAPCYGGPRGTAGIGRCRAGIAACDGGALGACNGEVRPAAEICGNGEDDDCDGAADEGCECEAGTSRVCGGGAGACAPGTQTCRGGRWGACEGAVEPAPERCNGIDDDCNGQTDEIFADLGAACAAGEGLCRADGRRVCTPDGAGTHCDAVPGAPSSETCDALDEDCDGQTDENVSSVCYTGPPGTADVGRCHAGRAGCVFGVPTACADQVVPRAEICNGIDDDCDGAIDEDAPARPCYDGDASELAAPNGRCMAGRQRCIDGEFGACEGQIGPAELDGCDGVDEDCDGVTDEDCECREGAPCEGESTGACAPGVQRCVGGRLAICEGRIEPADEICNDLDDDCDGAVDEDAAALCYDGPDGTSGVGLCRAGHRACGDETCVGAIAPRAEICNGLDDNCDGRTDENFGGVGGACAVGVGACAAAGIARCAPDGAGVVCGAIPGEPRPEICNGIDDDCDGATDEDADRACYDGPAGTDGVGVCTAGRQTCADGRLSACEGQTIPGAEICDGALDEDCDGIVDEGCACEDGDSRPCGPTVGACRAGVQACEGGRWGACEGGTGPADERCNGIDDDCDGRTDETYADLGLTCAVGEGACRAEGTRICRGDITVCDAQPRAPRDEICDGVDDDCDGLIDEETDASCYDGPDGTADVGRCRAGVARCVLGAHGACDGQRLPREEICNGVDDDCDGAIDDAILATPCYDGPPDELEVPDARCRAGLRGCDGVCAGQIGPAPAGTDLCDGVDDNCDGLVDEDCACRDGALCEGLATGACDPGVQVCDAADPNQLAECIGRVDPTSERCNGADDNCDGLTDEDADAICYSGPDGTAGVGLCAAGTQRCDRVVGRLEPTCRGEITPIAERCNGLDDDCDGAVDEDFADVGAACSAGIGTCRAPGRVRCAADGDDTICSATAGAPRAEACNGIDDDCDGRTDEGADTTCYDGPDGTEGRGLCRTGIQSCVDGALGACEGQTRPAAERCDGSDDENCDGAVDEGCGCEDGDERACGSDVGACAPGRQTCADGAWGVCLGGAGPRQERCDGVDNDCDGTADEPFRDLGAACSTGEGACRRDGVRVCAADGASTRCGAAPGAPRPETCDGVDEDCDGLVDEATQTACYQGPAGTAGVGQCHAGVSTCTDGARGPCQGAVEPQPEICDGLDNDCDGLVDQDVPPLPCYDGDPADLEPDAAVCRAGERRCVDGERTTCLGQRLPEPDDICDGADGDCDGQIDEDCGCREGLPCAGSSVGLCEPGVQICDPDEPGRIIGCADRVEPQPEICNGEDDNCDGRIDEDADAACYTGPRGSEGTGRCRAGVRRCDRATGEPVDACDGELTPVAERCNGIDDDCDGEIDEIFDDLGRACTVGIGACAQAGVIVCAPGGGATRCDATPAAPDREICNAVDDDCDGATDEGADATCYSGPDGTESIGRCRAGLRSCDFATGTLGACAGEAIPAAETCDGVDDDCDGAIDEGCACVDGDERPCGSETGVCALGRQRCAGGAWSACLGAVGPVSEICDGRDNDCDGDIDETFGRLGAPCASGVGACRAQGALVCAPDGEGVLCDAAIGAPSPEICDGRDNDCDGTVDEGTQTACYGGPGGTAGLGACRIGAALCVDGAPGACAGDIVPSEERCNGVDDDCDGLTDEDLPPLPCYDGDPAELTAPDGTCREGARRCDPAAGAYGACEDEVRPAIGDDCDGLDEDCDGLIDEDCGCHQGQPCAGAAIGACRPGTQVCTDGAIADCADRIDPRPETCDGVDEDCDGLTDEDTDVACYEGPDGTADVGICRAGVRRCIAGIGELDRVCRGQVRPGAERCNGLDDDCDGLVDEGFDLGMACTDGVGACRRSGTRVCAPDGASALCTAIAGEPRPETCNGEDDDCDGATDEDADRVCYDGPPDTAGVGQCRRGVQTCDPATGLGPCEGTVRPTDEICGPVGQETDENCDGAVDEGCACADGDERACGLDQGACHPGTQVCANGVWASCRGDITPTAERCNGVDDNCDGDTDEAFPDLGIACRAGIGACERPGRRVCRVDGDGTRCDAVAGTPAPEHCNGLDDDCDGDIDEDAAAVACYDGPDPTRGVGECRDGARACVDGASGPCLAQVGPTDEICDGLDNDCDGATDEDIAPIACYGGDPADLEAPETACRAGLRRCDAGRLGVCEGEVGPAGPDGCDGIDDDCDGTIDEDCGCQSGAPCLGIARGVCFPGTQVCADGELVECTDRVEPGPERCNGLDDDCDGATDEESDADCYTGAPGTRGVGLCRDGLRRCDRVTGRLDAACSGEIVPAPERCNGADDDCDGAIDEAFPERGAPCRAGVGVCAAEGRFVCATDGDGVECDAAPAPPTGPERCNDLDDNCDGAIDEGADTACYDGPAGTAGVGRCRAGTAACVDGAPGACFGQVRPEGEACDGQRRDEDCDGVIDEGCACNDGDSRACGPDLGACMPGLQLCVDGAWGTCLGGTPPRAETCNGRDDDCDGTIDEDLPPIPCYGGPDGTQGVGTCRGGTRSCVDGQLGPCEDQVRPAATDDCDGVDADCDGTIDEDYAPVATTCGQGECRRAGQTVCRDGAVVDACTPGPPALQRCGTGRDEDCDGDIDEGFALGGPCRVGRGECAADGTVICAPDGDGAICDAVPSPPDIELCATGRDEDCDGLIDEGFPDLGAACEVGRGACRDIGTIRCAPDGRSAACSAVEGAPSAERCFTHIDEDCDGLVDEGFDAVGDPCDVGLGVCARSGQLQCSSDGTAVECSVAAGVPSDELCDTGLDEDCDGAVDEGFAIGVVCAEGLGLCRRAGVTRCAADRLTLECSAQPVEPTPEICGNGLDEDCDGTNDEGFPVGEACNAGFGPCAVPGFFICSPDGLEIICDAEPLPPPGGPDSLEICDGIDDDCDGAIDEDFDGQPLVCGVGVCRAEGTTRCQDGAEIDDCTPGAPTGLDDTCDGLDNDCDGLIDESAAVRPETCNAIDDDCDGIVDEDPDGAPLACQQGNAFGACVLGECQLDRCEDRYFDDDGDLIDGCERGCDPAPAPAPVAPVPDDWDEVPGGDTVGLGVAATYAAPDPDGVFLRPVFLVVVNVFAIGEFEVLPIGRPDLTYSWPTATVANDTVVVVARWRDAAFFEGLSIFTVTRTEISEQRFLVERPGRPVIAKGPQLVDTPIAVAYTSERAQPGAPGGSVRELFGAFFEIDGTPVAPRIVQLGEDGDYDTIRPTIEPLDNDFVIVAATETPSLRYIRFDSDGTTLPGTGTTAILPDPIGGYLSSVLTADRMAIGATQADKSAVLAIPIELGDPTTPRFGPTFRRGAGADFSFDHAEIAGGPDDFYLFLTRIGGAAAPDGQSFVDFLLWNPSALPNTPPEFDLVGGPIEAVQTPPGGATSKLQVRPLLDALGGIWQVDIPGQGPQLSIDFLVCE